MGELGGRRAVGLGGDPGPDVGRAEDATGLRDPSDDVGLEGLVQRLRRGLVRQREEDRPGEVGRAGARVAPLDPRWPVTGDVVDGGAGGPVDAPVEHDVLGVVARAEDVGLGTDDEAERGRRRLGGRAVATDGRAARLTERVEEPVERAPDVAEDDVGPERVPPGLAPRHAGEVDREPERDERADPPEVLRQERPEGLVAEARGDRLGRDVNGERGPRLGRVPDEGPQRALVPRLARELRWDGERRGPVDRAERGRGEGLREERLGAHPGPLRREGEPAAGLGGDLGRAGLVGRDPHAGLGVAGPVVVDGRGGGVYVGVVGHRDRGLPRSW
nr:hypothetical protein [Rubrivirga marina]